ncbi:transposase [uncultured Oscillibacter sp.]|uniref:IS110 family transposase n=1 Tax=uncultured Oscillibacter sp. TaxID=876091 RepID=UPI00272A1ED6|nr:transposase [uncultured Oscillibacter sp.]
MFIVGIDIAKRSHMVCVIDSEGRTVCRPFSIRNSCSGYNTLLERLRKLTNHKRAPDQHPAGRHFFQNLPGGPGGK